MFQAPTTILDLANETLCHIISYLRAPDAERLARTLNSVLTPLCLLFLKSRIARARNERKMIAVFGDLQGRDYEGLNSAQKTYEKFNLAEKYRAFLYEPGPNARSGLRTWDYLEIDRGLTWLQPLDECTAANMNDEHEEGPAADEKAMYEFENVTSRLGFTLPAEFVHLMTSAELQTRIPSVSGSCFSFGDPLPKINSQTMIINYDTTAAVDGYAVRIYKDEQDSEL
jgi:hypothetical protein